MEPDLPPDDDLPDVAAMCRQAGVPVDDAGAHELVRIVARFCADLCQGVEPIGDADHVPRTHARAVGAELATQIRAVFDTDC